MLEFLGLEQEAATLTLCLIVIGAAIGVYSGYSVITDGKESKFGTVLGVLCSIAGIGAVIFGALPGIALFFTFQWNIWIWGIIYGALVGGVIFGLTWLIHRAGRKRRYANNPLMKKIVRYCREKDIAAVQCFDDRVRFFGAVDYVDYCTYGRESKEATSWREYNQMQMEYKIPELWRNALNAPSCIGELVFTELGYDKLPDLDMFATVLTKKLGWTYAQHYAEITWFEEGKWEGNTKTNTNHICRMYHDYYVFRKKYARQFRLGQKEKALAEKRADRQQKELRRERLKSGKSWE